VYLVPLMGYLTFEISSPYNMGQGSLKIIGNGTIRNLWYHFLLVFYSTYGPISYSFGDTTRYCLKIVNFYTLPVFSALIRVTPS